MLRETVLLAESDFDNPSRVLLPDILRDACIDRDAVLLYPNAAELEGVTLFDLLRDTEFVRVAENEHDLNNGLHDRVTLPDAGLLRDTLLLADGDIRLLDTLGDLLFDTGIDFVRVRLNPNVGVRLGDPITDIVLDIDLVTDGLLELDLLCERLLDILLVFVAVLLSIEFGERVSDAETLTDRDIVRTLDGDGGADALNETVLDGVAVRETDLEPLGVTDRIVRDLVRDGVVVRDMVRDGLVVRDLVRDGVVERDLVRDGLVVRDMVRDEVMVRDMVLDEVVVRDMVRDEVVISDLVRDGEMETVFVGDCVCASVSNRPSNNPLRDIIALLLMSIAKI